MKLISHSTDSLPRPAKPDSGIVLDPEQLAKLPPDSALPFDFAVLLKPEHLSGAAISTHNPNWKIVKQTLQEAGYRVVEWHDSMAGSFCARCTKTN